MTKFKYEIDDTVKVKREFQVSRTWTDEHNRYTVDIPEGATGTIESLGWNTAFHMESSYDVLFKWDDVEIEVTLSLGSLESLCEITKGEGAA